MKKVSSEDNKSDEEDSRRMINGSKNVSRSRAGRAATELRENGGMSPE
jgi:hypothetical protein